MVDELLPVVLYLSSSLAIIAGYTMIEASHDQEQHRLLWHELYYIYIHAGIIIDSIIHYTRVEQ